MKSFKANIKRYLLWLVIGLVYFLGQAERMPEWQNLDALSKRNTLLLGLHGLTPLIYYFIIVIISAYIINKGKEYVFPIKSLAFLYLWFGLITAFVFGMNFFEFPVDTALMFRYLPLINNSLPIILSALLLLLVGPLLIQGLEKCRPSVELSIVLLGGLYLIFIPFANHFFLITSNSMGNNWLLLSIYIFILYHWLSRQKRALFYWIAAMLVSLGLETIIVFLGENRFQLIYNGWDIIGQPIILFIAIGLVLFMNHLQISIKLEVILSLLSAIIMAEYLRFSRNILNCILPIKGDSDTLNTLSGLLVYTIILLISWLIFNFCIDTIVKGWQTKRWQSPAVTIYVNVLAASLITGAFALSNAVAYGTDRFSVFYNATVRPGFMLINFLIFIAIILILQVIINRPLIPAFISIIVFGIFMVASALKIGERLEPILPVELINVTNIPALVKMVNGKVVIITLLVVLGLIIGLIYVWLKFKKQKTYGWLTRFIIILLAGSYLTLVVLMPQNYGAFFSREKEVSFTKKVFDKMHYVNTPQRPMIYYLFHGQGFSFISTAKIKIMDKPAGYSDKQVEHVMTKYEKLSKKLNAKRQNKFDDQTVIYVLSESFSDPRKMPSVEINKNPIPNIDQLKQNNTSGLINSFGYGGGTADIEFESLTGLSMNNFSSSLTVPYVYLVPKMSYIPSVLNSFDHKIAIHPYTPYIYSRTQAFKKLGFEHFYNTKNPKDKLSYTHKLEKSEYISDQAAFDQTLKELETAPQSTFIQLSTMQNHSAYWNKYTNTIETKSQLKDNTQLETYVQGISFTDQAVSKFIQKISKMKRHITVVFYGDHNPGIYQYKSNYNLPNKFSRLMYNSDYFIYSNHTRKKVGPSQIVSPVNFTPMALEQTDSKVSPYYALLTEIWKNVPAGERGKFMSVNGEVSWSKLTTKQRKLLQEYQLIQYDITAGKKYTLRNKKEFYSIPK